MAGIIKISSIGRSLVAGETLKVGYGKGLLVITSQSGGWSACYVVSFGSIYEISVDDRARSQVSVAVVDGFVEITNTYSNSRSISALLIGY